MNNRIWSTFLVAFSSPIKRIWAEIPRTDQRNWSGRQGKKGIVNAQHLPFERLQFVVDDWGKKKGMHRKTFDRLELKYNQL